MEMSRTQQRQVHRAIYTADQALKSIDRDRRTLTRTARAVRKARHVLKCVSTRPYKYKAAKKDVRPAE